MRVGPVRSAMSGASQPRGPALLFPTARGVPAKRLLDADDSAAVAAKCPRLSECSSPPDYLSPPGSPCTPQPPPAAPGASGGSGSAPGPSRIADYLLLPLAEREHVSRALCIHTGRELRCKNTPSQGSSPSLPPEAEESVRSRTVGKPTPVRNPRFDSLYFPASDFSFEHRDPIQEEETQHLEMGSAESSSCARRRRTFPQSTFCEPDTPDHPQLSRFWVFRNSPDTPNTRTLSRGSLLPPTVFPIKHYQDKIRPYIQLPSHSNITGIVEVILGETKAYVFFEKDFGDMHSYVRSRKRLREEEAARLFKQIVSAVAHCHQSAIVLGDLKLRKFVFSTEERTQLRLESLEDTHIIKGEDDALSDKHGCPAYVSPEILNTTGTYSGKAADVWSLGVMLYTLLVGRYPFHDSDPSALFSKIRRGQFCIPEHISPKARCLIRSLLRREPSERLTAPEILLHPWFESILEPGYIDSEIGTSDQIVPEYQEDSDMSSFFC
ncbi:Tribbles 1 [Saguinus oedipus]|uniref:Tribbles 1 n=1 Tax=Saguinus oedipus TaxID=9490 RepID=A0ABQ9UE21_SAGOE|nr:Tribbles 1 [Saguinus oedipus]